jgi:hypothetical protein
MPPTLHPPTPMFLLHSSIASKMLSSSLKICIVVDYLVQCICIGFHYLDDLLVLRLSGCMYINYQEKHFYSHFYEIIILPT